MNRSWIYIFIGVLFELIWVIGFKHAAGFLSWIATVASLVASFSLAIQATKQLPVGTVYAVFTGLGTACTVLADMFLFHEPMQPVKLLLILLMLVGVIGLKLVGGSQAPNKEIEQ